MRAGVIQNPLNRGGVTFINLDCSVVSTVLLATIIAGGLSATFANLLRLFPISISKTYFTALSAI